MALYKFVDGRWRIAAEEDAPASQEASASTACYVACPGACEAQAYRTQVRRLKSTAIHEAAELARLLQHDDLTEELIRHLHAILQRLKVAGMDGV